MWQKRRSGKNSRQNITFLIPQNTQHSSHTFHSPLNYYRSPRNPHLSATALNPTCSNPESSLLFIRRLPDIQCSTIHYTKNSPRGSPVCGHIARRGQSWNPARSAQNSPPARDNNSRRPGCFYRGNVPPRNCHAPHAGSPRPRSIPLLLIFNPGIIAYHAPPQPRMFRYAHQITCIYKTSNSHFTPPTSPINFSRSLFNSHFS